MLLHTSLTAALTSSTASLASLTVIPDRQKFPCFPHLTILAATLLASSVLLMNTWARMGTGNSAARFWWSVHEEKEGDCYCGFYELEGARSKFLSCSQGSAASRLGANSPLASSAQQHPVPAWMSHAGQRERCPLPTLSCIKLSEMIAASLCQILTGWATAVQGTQQGVLQRWV